MPYTPKPPPRTKPEFQDLYDYIEQELQSISRELLETGQLELRTTNSAPIRPREGMIAQADGTDWNPGEGAGTYKYEAGNWVKFGDASHVHTLADVTDAGALAALDQADVANIGPIATDRILGRDTAGSGDAEELTLSQVLDFIGSAARGDLLVRGASAWARLAKGTSGQFLSSDGTDPLWDDVPGGWTQIQENSPTSGSTSDFTDIPQTHKALLLMGRQLDFAGSCSVALKFGTTNTFGAFYNGFAGSLGVNNTTFSGLGGLTLTSSEVAIGAGTTTNDLTAMVLIFDYASTSRYKLIVNFSMRKTATNYFYVQFVILETTSPLENIRVTTTSTFVGGTYTLVGLF
jgi:hypothetical protein